MVLYKNFAILKDVSMKICLRASSLVLRHSLSALRFSRSCHGIPMSTRWYSDKNAQFFSSRLHAFHTYMNHSVVVVTDINIFSIYEKVFSSLCASVFQRTLLEWKNVHKKSFHVKVMLRRFRHNYGYVWMLNQLWCSNVCKNVTEFDFFSLSIWILL